MHPRRAWGLAAAALLLLVGVVVYVRWPGFTQGGFASHDVAGILYNAMVLHAGGLPYVDTIELKAPGTFYLAALLAGSEGREIASFQIWANLWAILSLGGVAAIGGVLWGPRAAVTAATVYAVGDAFLDSMDANYVTWAQLPQIAAIVFAAIAATTETTETTATTRAAATPRLRWRRYLLWGLAGALAGVAALCKRPAAAVVLVVAAWALFAPGPGPSGVAERPRWRRIDLRALLAVLLGFVAAHLPIAGHYLLRGELAALATGYLWNPWGVRYLAGGGGDGTSLVAGLGEGARAAAYFLAFPLALALFTGLPRGQRRRDSPLPWLWLWVVMTLAAAALGLRFYKGYFVLVAPGLALLAAAPGGLLLPSGAGEKGNENPAPPLQWGRARVWRWALRGVALVLAALLGLRGLAQTWAVRGDRGRPHDLGARILAEHLARAADAPTPPALALAERPRIWVWGWHLWDLYPLTGRLAGSRIYKSLGLLTPPNDDTWRRPASRLRLADDPTYRELLLADLEASTPEWIILGSTVPHGAFTALHELLRRDYRRDHGVRIGRVEIWRRKGFN